MEPWQHGLFGGSHAIPRRHRRRLLVVGVAVLMLAVPVAVSASHIFSDVPTSSTYHTTVSRLVGAGITGGCGGGKYCPNDAVTRGQMAAFLNRGLGRGAGGVFGLPDWDTLQSADGALVGSTDLLSGGGVGGSAHVLVTGNLNAWTDEAGVCPCEIQLVIGNAVTGEFSVSIFEPIGADGVPTADPDHPGLFWESNATASWLFTVPSGTNNTFEMFAIIATTNPATTPDDINGFVTGWVSTMQATYVPFTWDGSNPEVPTSTQTNKGHFQPRGAH
jgi:S-layer homology domain